MPTFEISSTGGLFTATAAWVGGVVPTSATTSDILGSSTSGPLTISGLGNRTVGSWIMQDYTNILTFTGSATSIVISGPTFSMNSGITSSVLLAGNAHRFQMNGSGTSVQKLVMNGYRFRSGLNFMGSVRCEVLDELIFDENGWLMIGGVSGARVESATASVRAKMTMDPGTGRVSYLQGGVVPTTAIQYPHFIDLQIKNTTGSTNSVLLNSQNINSSIGFGTNVTINGGNLNMTAATLVLGMNCDFTYISGTFTGGKHLLYNLIRPSATYQFSTSSVSIPGVELDSFVIRQSIMEKSYFDFSNFNTKEFLITSEQQNKVVEINASQSFTCGEMLIDSAYPIAQIGGLYAFSNSLVILRGGKTYSIGSIASSGLNFGSYSLTSGGFNRIVGTAGQANISLTNDSVMYGAEIDNLNVSNKKIYALNSSITNSVNVESVLPTAGTASGGGETSYVFIE